MSLKELTRNIHRQAERKVFAQRLISGNITVKEYYNYLSNQYYNYFELEFTVKVWLPDTLHGIFRSSAILNDIKELQDKYESLSADDTIITKSTKEYVNYIRKISNSDLMIQKTMLLPHVYVRHFGDMFGGSIIKNRVPGSGSMYEFENKEFLIQELRKLLDNNMAMVDGAIICFDFVIRMFDELVNYSDLG